MVWRNIVLNPRLVACMLGSALAGVFAATLAVAAGWPVLLAFLAYSVCASIGLVLVTTALLPGTPLRTAMESPAVGALGEAPTA